MSDSSRTLGGLGLTGAFVAGTDGWADAMNANILKLSTLVQGCVLDVVSALPTRPSAGDSYILSKDNSVRVYDNSAWVSYAPVTGWRLYVKSKSANYQFSSSGWAAETTGSGSSTSTVQPIRMAGFFTTTPEASEILSMFVATDGMTIPASFVKSAVSVGTKPAAAFTLVVNHNGTQIGTIGIGTDGTVTMTAARGTTVAPGDLITVVAPAKADTTIANVAFTLIGVPSA